MLENLPIVLLFPLGLAWGSFLNVCIHRLPLGQDLLLQPSACPICHTRLCWYQNIPILSWMVLKGRCAACHAPIRLLYPIVELSTGCLVGLSGLHFGWSLDLGLVVLFLSSLIVASVIDLQHQIIPNRLTYLFLCLGLGQALVGQSLLFADFRTAILGSILGGGMLWSVAILYRKIRGKEGMGLGDAKFLAMIGAWLGWQAIPYILVIASLSGLLVALVWILSKRMTWDTPLPFGPFLSVGCLIYLFVAATF